MNYFFKVIENEDGSAIVIALLVLAVLTIIGISSSNVSNIELQIVRNEQIHQTNFYQAESSAQEAAQRIAQETNTEQLFPDLTGYDWMNDPDTVADLSRAANWNDLGVDSGDASDNSNQALINQNDASYAAVAEGVRGGSSLDLSSTRLYEFSIYGKSETNTGQAVIEVGYLRRF